MKVGDLVRCTKNVAPADFAGRLGIITRFMGDAYAYPYEIKMLDDADLLPVNANEIELPEEVSDEGR